jgi:hypothetical protein
MTSKLGLQSNGQLSQELNTDLKSQMSKQNLDADINQAINAIKKDKKIRAEVQS